MGTFNLGTFSGNPISRNRYTLTTSDATDVFKFRVSNNRQINLNLHNISAGDDANLRLYRDTNNNGIFDLGDQQVASSLQGGNANDVINYSATSGTYFAQVKRYAPSSNGIVSYNLELSGTSKPNTYQPLSPNQVFSLNSNLEADHIIYLDFDGHTTTGTSWNKNFGSSIVTPAYDTDGNTSNFSTAERETIWRIWQRVAEDFSPFDVNVTTAQPSDDQLKKTSGSDSQWGIRVVIGGDGSWYQKGTGGLAYMDSFNWDSDTPAFIFSENRAGGSEKSVAEAISHEVGHTLGLSHEGDSTNDYYYGHGNGSVETGWAPIMGEGNDRNLSQWSKGEYTGASNQEDDLDIITGQNGFGYRRDDYSNQLTSAAALSINDGQVENYGIIEKNNDIDWFEFNSTTGNIALDIKPFERGPNLDILAKLYNASGQLISSSNPIGSLSASFNLDLSPGQYYLSIDGTGQGNLATGYSDYGSLGQYSITGTVA
ncbi:MULTISPECIES: pre-peptidase C-terminal domain-containing protein [Moorena]|uniref:Bacterial pre-peptidase n=1 Tax=Moorena producens 3L TaxID=489825 RepID=F4XL83_9CYAN|nr:MULTISPECIES: pre-peptidase C-terminal domain-containing protein [Moorena]NEQ16852.1 hypothetical protein [Moorena sp. SIO3E2]EGJ34607.1 bacterial pre-peptidase [Moorena producens 3L]NEP32291.1 hypothetical protein [Moorena sp. SIO3B2]NEP69092.1 hypothetical protein [Moorena sp. SIO3A5]NEQ07280.1 hypothetical protein [Moorena sp. SIO4E2]